MSDASLFNLNALDGKPAAEPASSDAIPSLRSANQSQSLYRKYRPQTFAEDDLFGQEHVVNTLRNAIALNRIGHAYLFCGPRGTGKTTTARLLAKAVNCLDPDPYKRPCNVCTACAAINKGATTDVIEIDAASNRGIDDIRDLRERVKYAPTQLRTKFYIIDEAHQITGVAANAFLKTLEEPPAHTKFILATTDPEELLQTIVSRCQRFDFRRINLEAMQACLRKVAHEERIDIDADAVQAIARHATGSLRDALGLLDQVAVYRENDQDTNTRVTLDLVRTVLGVSRNDRVESIVQALADRNPGAGLRSIGEAVDAGEDMRQLGRQLVAYIRLLMLQRAGGSADADANARKLAEGFQLYELASLAQLFADIDYKVKHATLSQLPLELAIVEGSLRGTQPQSQVTSRPSPPDEARSVLAGQAREQPVREMQRASLSPIESESERMPEQPRPSLRDRVRGQPASAPDRTVPTPRDTAPQGQSPSSVGEAPPPMEPYVDGPDYPEPAAPRREPDRRQKPASPASPPAAAPEMPRPVSTIQPAASATTTLPDSSFEAIVELWPKIRADVKAVNRRIEALLQQVDPVSISSDKLVLMSAYEFHRNRVNSDEARIIIEDVVARLLKRHVNVSCVTREEAQSMIRARAASSTAGSAGSAAGSATGSEPTSPATSPVNDDETPEPNASKPSSVDSGSNAVASARDTAESPSTGHEQDLMDPMSDERVLQRLTAVKNIFDAEEYVEEEEVID